MSINLEPSNNKVLFSETYLPPSKEQMQNTFWGLKDRFYTQIFDGKYSVYGPNVFDEGLHGGVKETGFFGSVKKGCEFASEHFTKKLTIEFYKELHQKLCSHFKGEENHTEIAADKTGAFRNQEVTTRFSLKKLEEQAWKHYLICEVFQSLKERGITESVTKEAFQLTCVECIKPYAPLHPQWVENWNLMWEKEDHIAQKLSTHYEISKEWIASWELDWNKRVECINAYTAEFFSSKSACTVISLSKYKDVIELHYNALYASEFDKLMAQMSTGGDTNALKIEKLVQCLFDHYNQRVEKPGSIKEKVEAISELYQMLEWVHPFPDGQGRTDLVLQAMLLSEVGANPAILEEPYYSSYSMPSDWNAYLWKGIEAWKAERAKF